MTNLLYRNMMVNILNIKRFTTKYVYPKFIVRYKAPESYTEKDYLIDQIRAH